MTKPNKNIEANLPVKGMYLGKSQRIGMQYKAHRKAGRWDVPEQKQVGLLLGKMFREPAQGSCALWTGHSDPTGAAVTGCTLLKSLKDVCWVGLGNSVPSSVPV